MHQDEVAAKYRQASAFYTAKRFPEALRILDELSILFPDERQVIYARAQTLEALGRSSEALALCDIMIKRHNDARAGALKEKLEANRPERKPTERSSETPLVPADRQGQPVQTAANLLKGVDPNSSRERAPSTQACFPTVDRCWHVSPGTPRSAHAILMFGVITSAVTGIIAIGIQSGFSFFFIELASNVSGTITNIRGIVVVVAVVSLLSFFEVGGGALAPALTVAGVLQAFQRKCRNTRLRPFLLYTAISGLIVAIAMVPLRMFLTRLLITAYSDQENWIQFAMAGKSMFGVAYLCTLAALIPLLSACFARVHFSGMVFCDSCGKYAKLGIIQEMALRDFFAIVDLSFASDAQSLQKAKGRVFLWECPRCGKGLLEGYLWPHGTGTAGSTAAVTVGNQERKRPSTVSRGPVTVRPGDITMRFSFLTDPGRRIVSQPVDVEAIAGLRRQLASRASGRR